MAKKPEEAEVINEELSLPERMESFITTNPNIVKAVSMTRLEYDEYRGWAHTIDDDEDYDASEAVYLIEAQEDPDFSPNHKDHKGQVSMALGVEFEKAYKKFDYKSLGAKRTLAKFDPEIISLDERIKNKAAELIDLIQEVKKVAEGGFLSSERARLVAFAQTNAEMASDCGSKAVFTK